MAKTALYFIPGLAASSKIFEFLTLDEKIYEVCYLDWLTPLNSQESITIYAQRMCSFIKHENPVLVGVSFGGVLAQEISKLIKVKKVIIISSIKSNKELPKLLKIAQISKAYKLFPTKVVANFETYEKYFLGDFLQKKAELYKIYMTKRNPLYLNWAIYNVLHWQQASPLQEIIHIHGTKDKVFPVKYINNFIDIPNGNHAMILTKAKAISKVISTVLSC